MNALSLISRGYIDRLRKVVAQVPLPPTEAQSILVKALELPLPPELTNALGIHQSDIIVRSALVAAIADLRANPWLLDYVFASLPRDALTMKDYGEKEVEQAKKWFMSTNIPVFMNTRIDHATFPCISIGLQESTEAESTMADVHHQPEEENGGGWPALMGPFTPVKYDAASGTITIREDTAAQIVIAPGMVIVDRVGNQHRILEIVDNVSFKIKAGTIIDLNDAVLKGAPPAFITHLESVVYRETYSIGCHAQNEPHHLMYLHSIVMFCLLRYKEALLEARGFERSVANSSDMRRNESFGEEQTFSRWISLAGYVRQYWPKKTYARITGVNTEVTVEDIEDLDGIGVKLK